MAKFIITKRRHNDYLVHREGEQRGICTAWEQGHAERIAAAMNTAPFPGTPGDTIDRLLNAGTILAATIRDLGGSDGDIDLEKAVQLENALQYWSIVRNEELNKIVPQASRLPTEEKEPS